MRNIGSPQKGDTAPASRARKPSSSGRQLILRRRTGSQDTTALADDKMRRRVAFEDEDPYQRSPFTKNDVAVVLMGVTGSGKSTFISHLTQQSVQIRHSLESCTLDATVHTIEYGPEQNLHLIDTPGFNDTSRSDSEIFKEIAFVLGALRKARATIAGIIYLHRISEPRIAGSTLRSMRLFEAMCGPQSFPNVIFVSTMWESLNAEDYEISVSRERILTDKNEFWGRMVKGGAAAMRHQGDAESAQQILSRAASMEHATVMRIQRELIDEGMMLDETEAGRLLVGELWEARQRQRQEIAELEEILSDTAEDYDEATKSTIAAQQEEFEELIQRTSAQVYDLEITFDNLARERPERYASLVQQDNKRDQEIGEYIMQIQELEETLHQRKKHYAREQQRLARDNKRLQQLAEKFELENERLEERLREKRAAINAKRRAPQGYKAPKTYWEKVLITALPRDLQKVVMAPRSMSFPRSPRHNQTISISQPSQIVVEHRSRTYPEVKMTGYESSGGDLDGRPELIRRPSSSPGCSSRRRRRRDLSRSKTEVIELPPDAQISVVDRSSSASIEISTGSRASSQPSRYRAVVIAEKYQVVTESLGPNRTVSEQPSVLPRRYI